MNCVIVYECIMQQALSRLYKVASFLLSYTITFLRGGIQLSPVKSPPGGSTTIYCKFSYICTSSPNPT